MTLLIKNGVVYYQNKFLGMDIYVDEKGRMSMAETMDIDADEVIDASGLHIIPGLVDVHTHLREPGFEYKETIKTGSMAAAKGGYTTIFCMPNLKPCTDTVEHYEALKEIIKKDAVINVIPYATITEGELGKKVVDIDALSKHTLFFSDDGKGVNDDGIMLEAMHKCYEHNAMISAHCEDNSLLKPKGCVHDGKLTTKFNLVGISSASEYKQIERDLKLCELTHCQYNVCHISTKESVELIRQAKRKGLMVSCEVTPHHLLLCEDDVTENDGKFKMNPPLRSKQDQEALIEGIKDGTIEIIATDHAPHSAEEKSKGLENSAMGIIGLEAAFGMLYKKLVLTKVITLEKLVDLMSYNPCNIFGIDGGYIDQGEMCNIAIVNLNDSEKITEKSILSKGKCTPFMGQYMQGINYMTICNGKIVYRRKDQI